MSVALVTGASRGLGLEVSRALAARGWALVIDARDAAALARAAAEISAGPPVHAVAGDVTDPRHRAELAAAVAEVDGLDLLVNNASTLGPTPMPQLGDLPADALAHTLDTNVVAPMALAQLVLPQLRQRAGRIVNITSDAAREAYAGWGAYGTSKAALEQLTAILAIEQQGVRVHAFDPGDMRTQMHQNAFPDEDISDRPEPSSVVPAFLRLLENDLPSGRYSAAELAHAVRAHA